MKVKVWGCRGSLPTPGSKTLRYGGESTSIEVRSSSGQCIARAGAALDCFACADGMLTDV